MNYRKLFSGILRKRGYVSWRLWSILLIATHACAPAATTVAPQVVRRPNILQQSNLATVVPFELHEGFIFFPAEVDGRRGRFLLDTGSPLAELNDQYVTYTSTRGFDTLMTADSNVSSMRSYEETRALFHLHTIRIGSLLYHYDTMPAKPSGRLIPKIVANAAILHDERAQQFEQPVLGFIGLSILAPFETIIDYTHQRLIFIRLDTAGRRMVEVPAYSPVMTVPLILLADSQHYGVTAHAGTVPATLLLDTGAPDNALAPISRAQLGPHIVPVPYEGMENGAWRLDTFTLANKTYTGMLFEYAELYVHSDLNVLGYPFFSSFGTVGFNFRTRQFLVYH